ncbi:pyridoxamine 5'-phosphate oxidase [candidate division KSB1 bacterium]|nr:pyridoxamine 5'-phosphate oxidase [candidate division KSB1 bacterium]
MSTNLTAISTSTDPIELFTEWFEFAKKHANMPEPGAMCLSTIDANGNPNARIVLLKGVDERGFVFYTNFESVKGQELTTIPQAALTFYWPHLYRQVRVQGTVSPVSTQEADMYFRTRPRGSQLSAHASHQSRILEDPHDLKKAYDMYATQFEGKPVPRPTQWSGFRVVPATIEFWQAGDFRLHDRWKFTRQDYGWDLVKLYP